MPNNNDNAIHRAFNRILKDRIHMLKGQKAAEVELEKASTDLAKAQKNVSSSYDDVIKKSKELERVTKASVSSTKVATKEYSRFAQTVKEGSGYIKDQAKTFMREWLPSVTAGALAIKSLHTMTEATTVATKNWLHTGQRIDDISTSYATVVARGMDMVKVNKENVRTAYDLGKSIEYVTNVSNKWVSIMRFTELNDANRKSISDLTKQTILYADVLGIDAVEMQDKAAKHMFKYGMSADHAVKSLARVHYQGIAANEELGRYFGSTGAYLWPDDLIPLIDSASDSTRGYAQDIDTLTAAIVYSAEQAQKAGQTYTQSLDSARAFGKFITGEGVDDAFKLRIGYQQLQSLMAGPGGGISEDFMSQFDDSIQKQLRLIAKRKERGEADVYLAKDIQDILATTEQGITSQISEYKRAGGGRYMHLLQGLGQQEASLVSDILANGGSDADIAREIVKRRNDATAEMSASTQEALERQSRALSGKDMVSGALTGVDIQRHIDKISGEAAAQMEDPRVLAGGAAAVGIIGMAQKYFNKRATSGEQDLEADRNAIESALQQGSDVIPGGGQGVGSIETAIVRAISYFADGDRVRVTGDGIGGGAAKKDTMSDKAWEMATFQARYGMEATKMFMKYGPKLLGGAGGGGAAGGALRGGAKLAMGGIGIGGIAATGLAIAGGAAATLGGTGSVLETLGTSYNVTDVEKLYKLRSLNKDQPLSKSNIDRKEYDRLVATLSGDMNTAKKLVDDGVISQPFYNDIADSFKTRMGDIPATSSVPTGTPVTNGMTETIKSLIPNMSRMPGMGGAGSLLGHVTGINQSSGDITLTIKNGLAIPAAYDAIKNQ